MTLTEWKRGIALFQKERADHHFKLGDYVNEGINAFGSDECWQALKQITGSKNTRNFYRRCATVAALYPPSLRFANLTFNTYEALRHFPLTFLEKFVPSVADSGRSCKQILFLAIEQFGSNPAPQKKKLKRCSVNLSPAVYLAALEAAKKVKQQTQFWIEMVIKDALGAQIPPVPDKPTVPCDVQSAEPRPKTSEPYKPIEVDLSDEQEATRKWVRREGIGEARSGPPEYLDAEDGIRRLTDRPTYQQRREEQIAAGAQPIKKKLKGRDPVRGITPSMYGTCARATKFSTLEEAQEVAERYSAAKGYPLCADHHCDTCGFFHIHADDVKMAALREAARQRAGEIQAHVSA